MRAVREKTALIAVSARGCAGRDLERHDLVALDAGDRLSAGVGCVLSELLRSLFARLARLDGLPQREDRRLARAAVDEVEDARPAVELPCSRQDVVLPLPDAFVDLVGRPFEPADARCRRLTHDLVHCDLVPLDGGPATVLQLVRRRHGVELAVARLERLLRLEQNDPESRAVVGIAEHRVAGKTVELAELRQEAFLRESPCYLRGLGTPAFEPGDTCVHRKSPLCRWPVEFQGDAPLLSSARVVRGSGGRARAARRIHDAMKAGGEGIPPPPVDPAIRPTLPRSGARPRAS